jgi:hypothetical protein
LWKIRLRKIKSYPKLQSTKAPKNNDRLGRIRTGDLRRVKTEDLGVFEALSVGDITVRKANDPSYMV